MRTPKLAALAATLAVGLTAGVIAGAQPAMAAPGYATYTCTWTPAGSLDTEFDRTVSGNLVVTAVLDFTVPAGGATVTSTFDGVSGPSTVLPAGYYTSVVLEGPFAPVTAAPTTLGLTVTAVVGTLPISCNLATDGGGWPV